MIGPSAPNGPPVPIEMAEETGFYWMPHSKQQVSKESEICDHDDQAEQQLSDKCRNHPQHHRQHAYQQHTAVNPVRSSLFIRVVKATEMAP